MNGSQLKLFAINLFLLKLILPENWNSVYLFIFLVDLPICFKNNIAHKNNKKKLLGTTLYLNERMSRNSLKSIQRKKLQTQNFTLSEIFSLNVCE